MKSNSEYRKTALSSLKNNWTKAIIISAIYLTICNLSLVFNYIAINSTMPSFINGLNLIYECLVVLPITFAFIVIFLRKIRKPETDLILSLFTHFISNYGRAYLGMLLLFLIIFCFVIGVFTISIALASIPFTLLDIPLGWSNILDIHSIYGLANIFRSTNLLLYFLLCCIFFTIAVIPMIIYIYKICLFPFIIEDNPDIGIREAYHHSKVLMKGHCKQLFLLDLSFIGWYLLCLLTTGIGLLWVIPYQQTARAHFYNELKQEYDNSQYLSFK